jgi:hypothetical protein
MPRPHLETPSESTMQVPGDVSNFHQLEFISTIYICRLFRKQYFFHANNSTPQNEVASAENPRGLMRRHIIG